MDLTKMITEALGLPSTVDGTGIKMVYSQNDRVTRIPGCPTINKELERAEDLFGKLVGVMINIVPPGHVAPIHRDYLDEYQGHKYPLLERRHLPLQTNTLSLHWMECQVWNMPVGKWSEPFTYWKKHALCNFGSTDRIHLVVDFGNMIQGEYA